MQLCMQRNIVGVAHYNMDCFDVLGVLDDAPDDASDLSFINPGSWIYVFYSFIHAACWE